MWNLVMGTILAVGYLFIFWIFGAAVPAGLRPGGIPLLSLTGFLLYFSLFQLVAFPLKCLKYPLSYLTVAWGCIVLAVLAFVIVFRRKELRRSLSLFSKPSEKRTAVFVLIAVSVCLAVFVGLNTNTLSNYDSNNYIGLPVASVYSNTMELVDPFSGRTLTEPKHFYIMNTDTLQSAVIFQALKIHPLVERKWSFTIAMIILFEMALYKCAQIFFQENCTKTIIFVLLADMSLLFSYSISGASHYFSYRTYEGKAVTCYMYMLVIFLFCLAVYRGCREAWPFVGLFLCGTGGIAFCNTALYIIPAMTGLTLFPWLAGEWIKKRKAGAFLKYFMVLFPSAVWFTISRLI